MASTLKSIGGQALMYLKSETIDNVPVTAVVTVVDGIISKKEISTLINKRLIADPAYYRFKSLVLKSGYFKELQHFDAHQVLKVFKIKTEPPPSVNIIASNSRNPTQDNDDDIFRILAQKLSVHIHKYHNHPFNKTDTLPLWRGHILHFDDLNKTIFYLKSHHVICDGMSLSKTFLSLADNYQEINEKITDSIVTSSGFQQYKRRWKRPLLYILFVLCNGIYWFFDIFSLFYCHSEKASIIKPKQSNRNKSYYVLHNIPINAINRVRKSPPYTRQNVTINDYLLAVLSEALARFLLENDPNYGKTDGIINMGTAISMNGRDPVSLATRTDIDCCVGISQLNIPISSQLSMHNKVKYIKRQMNKIKGKRYAMFSALLLQFTGLLPRFIIPFLMKLQRASLLVSNVRGPGDNLCLCGHKVLSVSGVLQNSPGISLSFAICGYGGQCSISLLSDYNIIGSRTSYKILQYVADVLAEEGIGCSDNRNVLYKRQRLVVSESECKKSYGVNQKALAIFLGIVFVLFCSYCVHIGFVLT